MWKVLKHSWNLCGMIKLRLKFARNMKKLNNLEKNRFWICFKGFHWFSLSKPSFSDVRKRSIG